MILPTGSMEWTEIRSFTGGDRNGEMERNGPIRSEVFISYAMFIVYGNVFRQKILINMETMKGPR